MFISQLIKIACEVYSNREIKKEKKKQAKMKLQSLLAAVIVDKRNEERRRRRGGCRERHRGPGTGLEYGT